jgi:hypothetical protein
LGENLYDIAICGIEITAFSLILSKFTDIEFETFLSWIALLFIFLSCPAVFVRVWRGEVSMWLGWLSLAVLLGLLLCAFAVPRVA